MGKWEGLSQNGKGEGLNDHISWPLKFSRNTVHLSKMV